MQITRSLDINCPCCETFFRLKLLDIFMALPLSDEDKKLLDLIKKFDEQSNIKTEFLF